MSELFLPSIHNNAPVTGPRMSPNAQAFADAWLALLLEARRNIMRFDSRLAACATAHAEYLAQRTGLQLLESMHLGKDSSMPNGRARQSGYRLPAEYSSAKNNIESCCRDGRDPAVAARSLSEHEPHRQHMLGGIGFTDRTVWGCGSAGDDYVLLICPPEN